MKSRLTILAAMIPIAGSLFAPAGAEGALSFDVGLVVRDSAKTNIALSRNGTIFFASDSFVGRSADGGSTWTPLMRFPPATYDVVNPDKQTSFDRRMIIDPDTDRLFIDDAPFGCTILSWSDSLGESWEINPLACGGGFADHPVLAVGHPAGLVGHLPRPYPNTLYVCLNGLAYDHCDASLDGGRTFLPTTPAAAPSIGSGYAGTGFFCAFPGAAVVGEDGALYEAPGGCNGAVNRSSDGGVTWLRSTVHPGSSGAGNPSLAIGPDGVLYYLWVSADDFRPYLSRSFDAGQSWTEPYSVAPWATSSLTPVLVSGDAGRIGVAFYATTDDIAPGNPDYPWNHTSDTARPDFLWHLYIGVSSDATTPSPTFQFAKATEHPVQIGCMAGSQCDSHNPMSDFNGAAIGPDGRLYVSYLNGCPADSCTTHADSTASDGMVAIQISGPRLKG